LAERAAGRQQQPASPRGGRVLAVVAAPLDDGEVPALDPGLGVARAIAVADQRRPAVAELLGVLGRPGRRGGRRRAGRELGPGGVAPVRLAQDALGQDQALRPGEDAVIAELTQRQPLEGGAVEVVERLADDAAWGRAVDDAGLQLEDAGGAVVEDLV